MVSVPAPVFMLLLREGVAQERGSEGTVCYTRWPRDYRVPIKTSSMETSQCKLLFFF